MPCVWVFRLPKSQPGDLRCCENAFTCVCSRPAHRTGLFCTTPVGEAGKTALLARHGFQQYIVWLQVSMNDVQVVQKPQCLCNVGRPAPVLHEPVQPCRTLFAIIFDRCLQRAAFNVFKQNCHIIPLLKLGRPTTRLPHHFLRQLKAHKGFHNKWIISLILELSYFHLSPVKHFPKVLSFSQIQHLKCIPLHLRVHKNYCSKGPFPKDLVNAHWAKTFKI
mmetsp:Transcript_52199/g.103664  ORF Transcript_52199/g.103664 Transcript_52199/m.103664 type:complete len:220 (-) Transcript_52199:160-819(-)